MAQAQRDAVASATVCFLPLQPRRGMRGLIDGLQLLWDDYNIPSAEQCANAELNAKPRIYRVQPFTEEQRIDILYDARNIAEMQFREEGRRRPRPRARD